MDQKMYQQPPPGYPHPQPGYMQDPNQPGNLTTVVVHQPAVQVTPVGPNPVRTLCPSCGAQIVTKMTYEATTKTHLMALLLCCFLCWPCACLPYCMDSCQNANHYCPNCNSFIGTYTS